MRRTGPRDLATLTGMVLGLSGAMVLLVHSNEDERATGRFNQRVALMSNLLPSDQDVIANDVDGARARVAMASVPLAFIVNTGQLNPDVRVYARGSGFGFYLTPHRIVLSFVKERSGSAPSDVVIRPAASGADNSLTGAVLSLQFVGANPDPLIEAAGRTPGVVNYLIGADQARWRTGLAIYREVVYRDLWPGIDMLIRGGGGQLKYEFEVRPGASVDDIRLRYDGAVKLSLDPVGDLLIETSLGVLADTRPVTYQQIGGKRIAIQSAFILGEKDEATFGFEVQPHDSGYPLHIDPGLVYSTFLGGSSNESIRLFALDDAGNAYVTGSTMSANYPTTPGAQDNSFNGSSDLFVTKLDSNGAALYSTFLGGSSSESVSRFALDGTGNAYVTGETFSADYPTTSGAQDNSFNGSFDVFVTKLDAAGAALYSTFLGGGNFEAVGGFALDSGGNAYVTGVTASPEYPTTSGAQDNSFNGSEDLFATKLGDDGVALFSTFLGGASNEQFGGFALDGAGNAYVTGSTASADYPTTPGAQDNSFNGSSDVFVTKLGAAGAALYSTFVGGSSSEFVHGFALDGSGNAYLTGFTSSPDYPTTLGAQDNSFNGVQDIFVTKLDAAGTSIYSTFLGGTSSEVVRGFALDGTGRAYVTGETSSHDYPTTPGAQDDSFNGGFQDVFVTKLDPAGAALYSTFLGGASGELVSGFALDAADNAYVIGFTLSGDYPTTPGAQDNSFNGGRDVFVTKLDPVGAALYSTFLGGESNEEVRGFALDGAGSAYIAGPTSSHDYPTTPGAQDNSFNGGFQDVFVTRLDAVGTAVYSTFIGGAGFEEFGGLALDGVGTGYVAGNTSSADYPTTPGAQDNSFNGSQDVFVTKLDLIPELPASVSLDPPAGQNTVGTSHTVTATVATGASRPLQGFTVGFNVQGSVTTAGSCMTDSNGQCSFTYEGPGLSGEDTITAYADNNADGTLDPGEPQDTATKSWSFPASTFGQVTGWGQISNANNTGQVFFDLSAKSDSKGVKGTCNLVHLVADVRIECRSVTVLVRSGRKATLFGLALVNGASEDYRIDVEDNGTPGSGRDQFRMLTRSGYEAEGVLTEGNIRVN